MCMRASGASELRKFRHFTFLNCYFFQYFVGTSDTLSVQMTCLSAYMYRQISKCTDKFSNVPTKLRKSIIGGQMPPCPPPPPPPSGYANAAQYCQPRVRGPCFACGSWGHFARDCPMNFCYNEAGYGPQGRDAERRQGYQGGPGNQGFQSRPTEHMPQAQSGSGPDQSARGPEYQGGPTVPPPQRGTGAGQSTGARMSQMEVESNPQPGQDFLSRAV